MANVGFSPTELAIRSSQGRGVPVRIEIGGEGVDVLSSETRIDLGTIRGHGETEVEWVVRVSPGSTVQLEAWHPKAGRSARSLTP